MSFRDRMSGFLDSKLRPQQSQQPPPIPHHSKPTSSFFANTPPAAASPSQRSSQPRPYWAPSFDPARPVSDEFIHKTGQHGWGNNELQNYTRHAYNSHFTNDGRLLVRAIAFSGASSQEERYTSARLVARQTLSRDRGFLFARLTAPCASGVWPALWLLPEEPYTWPGDGEIDLFEVWNGGSNHACLHWGNYNGEDWNKHRVAETDVPQMTSPWGVRIGFAWDQSQNGSDGKLVWYIDGRPVMKATCPPGMCPMRDFTVVINVAMGGSVCGGKIPDNGSYDLVIHDLKLFDQLPFAGWDQFERDWNAAPEGRAG